MAEVCATLSAHERRPCTPLPTQTPAHAPATCKLTKHCPWVARSSHIAVSVAQEEVKSAELLCACSTPSDQAPAEQMPTQRFGKASGSVRFELQAEVAPHCRLRHSTRGAGPSPRSSVNSPDCRPRTYSRPESYHLPSTTPFVTSWPWPPVPSWPACRLEGSPASPRPLEVCRKDCGTAAHRHFAKMGPAGGALEQGHHLPHQLCFFRAFGHTRAEYGHVRVRSQQAA